MTFAESFKSKLFEINEENFEKYALEVFHFQHQNNPVYKSYVNLLPIDIKDINSLTAIPFLPISFWKNHAVKSGNWTAEKIFQSSGTTAQTRSQSHMKSLSFYETVFTNIFKQVVPDLENTEILALLPSYQQQRDSSLIYMVDSLMKKAHPTSKYYQPSEVDAIKNRLENTAHPKILFGVTYALLDLVEHQNIASINTTVIETGGMKGRRAEITRSALHDNLKKGLIGAKISSEYGMTELTSQSYISDNQSFNPPPWWRNIVRDINDPFSLVPTGVTGGLNIIDLANVDTCSFIETQDLGKIHPSGTFEVLGRFDNTDIRGCNLLV